MLLPKPEDAIHKAWMYRLLSAIADDSVLVQGLRFKGGTCAAMRGILPRFSVDLDFDLLEPGDQRHIRRQLEKIFKKWDLIIDDCSKTVPQYFLKYENRPNARNTIKLEATFPVPKTNEYEPIRFSEIDRILYTQTIPTMFANKLVAVMDRYHQHRSLAGRDLFDLQVFFLKGFSYKPEIIRERTGQEAYDFLSDLRTFIEKHFTQTLIDQDLNTLLPSDDFHRLRKSLKLEVLMLLGDEMQRLTLQSN